TTGSKAMMTQWATYMGDIFVSSSLNKGMKVQLISTTHILIIRRAIMGIFSSPFIGDKEGDTFLYCWAPIITKIK
ncbi:hypothetical protein KI387_026464, partial [Taxus chinensis]